MFFGSVGRSRSRILVAGLALPILAGACASDSAVAPLAAPTLDAALGELAHPALDYASAAFSGAGVVSLPIDPSRCPLEPATLSFVCAPLSGGGLTLTQRYTMSDAAGTKQSAFDPKTTTSVSVASAVAGTAIRDGNSITVDGQQQIDLAGLGTSRHTLNGSSLTLATLVDPTRVGHPPVKTTVKTTMTNLVLPVLSPDKPQPWPLSGTINITSLSDYGETLPTGGTTIESVATITFHGSSLVSLTITVPGGVRTCDVNIAVSALGCSS